MSIEDAITSPTPVWVPPRVHTAWQPLWAYQGDGSRDDLTEQAGPTATVKQSFDDGLPDTVTLTSTNDAVASLNMDLLGRGPVIANEIGWRTAVSGSQFGANDEVYAQWPADLEPGDLVITTFAVVPSVTTPIKTVDDMNAIPNDQRVSWLLSDFVDPSGAAGGVRIITYASIAPPGEAGFFFGLNIQDVPTNYRWAWVANAVYARRGAFNVGVRPGTPVTVDGGNAGTISGLSVPLVAPRGYIVTAFATRDTTLTGTDTSMGNVISADPGSTDVRLLVQRSGIVGQGSYARNATKGATNDYSAGVGIPLIIADTPQMDARQYFSVYNDASPVAAFERDIAPVTYDFGVLTSTGPDYQRLFTGQMSDVPVKSRTAELLAMSATRIKMMKAVRPPVIWGAREGANLSWVLSYIWAQCGLFVSPRPSTWTRYWNPLHGSLREFIGSGSNRTEQYDATGTTTISPSWTEGPYVLGMYGERTTVRTIRNIHEWQPSFMSVPPFTRDDIDPAAPRDILSLNGGVGRWSMWVRGDAAEVALPYVDGAAELVNHNFVLFDSGITADRAAIVWGIRKSNRRLFVRLYDIAGNDTTWESTLTLPSDGAWHFVSWSWDWAAGLVKARLDGTEQARVGAITTSTAILPDSEWGYLTDTDPTGRAGTLRTTFNYSIPAADAYLDSGIGVYTDPYIPDLAFTPDVVTRTLDVAVEALIEPVAREAWAIMVDIAQASLSSYRTDELDRVCLLPLKYFGEDALMDPEDVVIDTRTNAEDPDVIRDPTRIRNNVTVEFNETRVDDTLSVLLEWSTSMIIQPGTTDVTFALDTTTVSITANQQFRNLTAAEIAAGEPFPTSFGNIIPLLTVNDNDAGTGNYMEAYQVSAIVVSFDSDSVTVRFKNNTGGRRYMVNNGSEVPFMRVVGYAVRSATGYATTSDPASIAKRGERALSVQVPYLQRRQDATMISGLLTAMLCGPTGSTKMTVFGDPTREPGQLITVADAQGTNISGTWRVTAIDHTRDGAEYTQDMSMVQQAPVAVWDVSNWDEDVWGE
jgi:hypothetical protein